MEATRVPTSLDAQEPWVTRASPAGRRAAAGVAVTAGAAAQVPGDARDEGLVGDDDLALAGHHRDLARGGILDVGDDSALVRSARHDGRGAPRTAGATATVATPVPAAARNPRRLVSFMGNFLSGHAPEGTHPPRC